MIQVEGENVQRPWAERSTASKGSTGAWYARCTDKGEAGSTAGVQREVSRTAHMRSRKSH